MEGGHRPGDRKPQITQRLRTRRTLKLGWALHQKFETGLFERNTGRLVARGNHQSPGIDYSESFSPVMRLEPLCTILALAAICDLDVIQFDITSAYLEGRN